MALTVMWIRVLFYLYCMASMAPCVAAWLTVVLGLLPYD